MVLVEFDRETLAGTAHFGDGAVYDFKVHDLPRCRVHYGVHSMVNVATGRRAVNPTRGAAIENAVCKAFPVIY